VKKIYRNQETDEVLKHFRLRYGLILVFCNYKTLIMQQILGNTNRMIKGHDITSLTFNKYMLVKFPESKTQNSLSHMKSTSLCAKYKHEIANQISFVALLKKHDFKYYRQHESQTREVR
jgi:hypothetical protein